MTEAFELLDRQPEGWPRWQHGENMNGTVTDDQHLFIFVPQIVDNEVSLAAIRPACYFMDGSSPIDYERTLRDHDEGNFTPHCYACLEVELQYGLV